MIMLRSYDSVVWPVPTVSSAGVLGPELRYRELNQELVDRGFKVILLQVKHYKSAIW